MTPCDKKRWPGVKSATRAARRYGSRYQTDCRAYRCRDCGGWHLTTKERIVKEVKIDRPAAYGSIRGRIPAPGESVQELAERMRRGG